MRANKVRPYGDKGKGKEEHHPYKLPISNGQLVAPPMEGNSFRILERSKGKSNGGGEDAAPTKSIAGERGTAPTAIKAKRNTTPTNCPFPLGNWLPLRWRGIPFEYENRRQRRRDLKKKKMPSLREGISI
jgi:hypothetical protein